MTLPKRPPLSDPIPNADVPNVPRKYTVKAPYWDAIVSGDLVVRDDGTLAIEGSTIPPIGEVEVAGEYWGMPLGNGLGLWRGEFRTLETEYPPYGCRTDVITSGVTDFTDAWRDCTFASFPSDIDTSSGTNFSYCWYGCGNLKSFPALDFSSGEDFTYSWAYTGLTSFPTLDLSNGTTFASAWASCDNLNSFPVLDFSLGTDFTKCWYYCTSLTSFPGTLNLSSGTNFSSAWQDCNSLSSFPGTLDLSSGTNFSNSWAGCTSLTSFPAGMFDNCLAVYFQYTWVNCALSQQSVDNILISLDTAGQTNGIVNIDGGTSSAPGASGAAAKASLVQGKGWTVLTN